MDWRGFQISLDGAFDRARAWFVPLAHVCWMSVPVAMVASGNHIAASVSIDFVAFREWMRDTGRSAWWIVPFFVLPAAIIVFTNPEQNSIVAVTLRVVAAGLYFWGFAEMSGLRRLAGSMQPCSAATRHTGPNPSRT
ncbi:hypothetical protein [Bradyrhizobium sp.]|uniref:hypothetical protein n=1 Tax=Bradyrhizobium sp. TaxID=376 RepID=UPI002D297E42|nr:hypothetical protein [Bradyrhizobium sp.]HZR73159.1 hypothetical protein [Bradyrhizobium sp.]